MKSLSIGMFDSGLGGLTVLREVLNKLPFERVIYFGDTARLPYGNKSAETIIRYSLENAEFLLQKNIKLLVVACNTATAHGLETLKERFSIPIIGVIEPGARRALEMSHNKKIAVLGTKGTIFSQVYEKEFKKRDPEVELFPIACPLFVHLVEEEFSDHAAARLIVKEYLKPLQNKSIDTLLLGCTHYLLLKKLIQEEVGDHVQIVDSGSACADEVAKVLHEKDWLINAPPTLQNAFFVSDDPKKFCDLGKNFLGRGLHEVEFASSFQCH